MSTVERVRIEVLVDAPLVGRVTEAAKASGVTGYTLLPTLGGYGNGGAWSDDQVTGAEAKVLFLTVAAPERAAALVDALRPLLESHGLIVLQSAVNVVRGNKF